ncbi:hypothetical protein D3C73_454310 [compost metagenome]
MASTAYDQSVRSLLNKQGINNSRIGYNGGAVTIDGKTFMTPEKNYNGASYTSAQSFNSAWNSYNQPTVTSAGKAASGVSSTGFAVPKVNAPTATAPVGGVGVRSALQAAGYDPKSIGYTGGNVTVNGKTFMTPTSVVNGTSYTSQPAFNSALQDFRINDLTDQAVSGTKLPDNQYTGNINDVISQLMGFSKNQQSYDPYSSPEYAAFKAQQDKAAQQGIRSAQEALGSAGFGRSTALGERAQGIQNDSNEYLQTQVIPQLIAANEQKKQQEYSNLYNLLSPLMGQQGYADNRAQTELGNIMNVLGIVNGQKQQSIDNARSDSDRTGIYQTPEIQSLTSQLLQLKQSAEAPGVTASQRQGYSKEADRIRSTLQSLGVDISGLGSNTASSKINTSNVGIKTLAGKESDRADQNQAFNQKLATDQFAYQKARDAITDAQWKATFDEDVRQKGLAYALDKLQTNSDISYKQAMLALNQDQNDLNWVELDAKTSTPTDTGLTAKQLLDSMTSLYSEPIYTKDKYGNQTKTGTQITKDATKRKSMFESVIDAGKSDQETRQILNSLGFTKDEIEKLKKEYSKN